MLLLAALLQAVALARGRELDANATNRIAFGSCNKHALPQPLWPAVRRRRPNAWVWAGDVVYGDRMAKLQLPKPIFEARGVEYLRDAYATQNALPEYAALKREAQIIATWDDHDFGLNDGDRTLPFREASRKAFLEGMDVTPAGAEGVYSASDVALDVGTVRVVALDMRFSRDPYDQPDGDFLGEAQWAWLGTELANASHYHAVVIVSSLQLLEPRYGLGESWGKFPGARTRFIGTLATCRAPLVVISGDVHMAEIAAARCGRKLLVDVTSSGMTHSWKHQTLASFPAPVARLLTSLMVFAHAILPHVYQVLDANGARQHYLDLNFGELEFVENRLVVRIFGPDGLALQQAWDLDVLGVDGACAPFQGELPAWRHGLSVALWVASLLFVALGPVVVALWVAARVLFWGIARL